MAHNLTRTVPEALDAHRVRWHDVVLTANDYRDRLVLAGAGLDGATTAVAAANAAADVPAVLLLLDGVPPGLSIAIGNTIAAWVDGELSAVADAA